MFYVKLEREPISFWKKRNTISFYISRGTNYVLKKQNAILLYNE